MQSGALKELQDDTSGGVRAHVETLARNQADFQAELDGVRVDLQSMQGRTGDQERINENLRQDLALLRDELSLQVADHAQRLALLESGWRLRLQPSAPSPSASCYLRIMFTAAAGDQGVINSGWRKCSGALRAGAQENS